MTEESSNYHKREGSHQSNDGSEDVDVDPGKYPHVFIIHHEIHPLSSLNSLLNSNINMCLLPRPCSCAKKTIVIIIFVI